MTAVTWNNDHGGGGRKNHGAGGGGEGSCFPSALVNNMVDGSVDALYRIACPDVTRDGKCNESRWRCDGAPDIAAGESTKNENAMRTSS